MRLTVPEPKIDLYKDGFKPGELDQLGRKETGDKLPELTELTHDFVFLKLVHNLRRGRAQSRAA